MRRTRPLIAIAMHLLMLHVVFMSGAWACPMAGGPTRMRASMMRDGAHEPMLGNQGDGEARRTPAAPSHRSLHHEACDMSCTPSGCSALGHCSTMSARCESAAAECASEAATTVRPPHAITHLASVSVGPEPPPPRS